MTESVPGDDNKRLKVRTCLVRTVDRLYQRHEDLKKKSKNFSWYRLGIFAAGVITLIFTATYASNLVSAAAALIFITVFAVAAHLHNKLDQGIKKLKAWIKIKESQVARMDLNWPGIPGVKYESSEDFTPVEIDLNIAGENSLHKLVCTAGTEGGRGFLRNLLNPKPGNPDLIAKRQRLIRQLIPMPRFRERLMLISALHGKRGINTSLIRIWTSESLNIANLGRTIFLLTALSAVNIILIILSILGILPAYWIISTIFYFLVYNMTGGKLKPLFEGAELINDELSKLAAVFEFLRANGRLCSGELGDLCSIFCDESSNPSVLINKTERYTSFLEMKNNPFVWLSMMFLFPVDHLIGLLVEKIKRKIDSGLDTWLSSLFEIEGFSSIANFAYLNPDYVFPKIAEGTGVPVLKTSGLGHPLIKHDKKITNDLLIEKNGEVAILTGSNMSGKSTLLRSIGINLALAYAGSPVNASSFEIPILNLFTCIKVSDSVTDGISYFYAEVKRLKALLEEIKKSEVPVFFLIDEIFRGTNNIERLAGSRAYIKALSASGAAGIVATHDLELVKLENEIPNIVNYHFRESVSGGKMEFDYKLREGPCPTTNALKIMKMEGLPVE